MFFKVYCCLSLIAATRAEGGLVYYQSASFDTPTILALTGFDKKNRIDYFRCQKDAILSDNFSFEDKNWILFGNFIEFIGLFSFGQGIHYIYKAQLTRK